MSQFMSAEIHCDFISLCAARFCIAQKTHLDAAPKKAIAKKSLPPLILVASNDISFAAKVRI